MLRRSLLRSMLAAPAVITTPGLLMPVKALVMPETRAAIDPAIMPIPVVEWRMLGVQEIERAIVREMFSWQIVAAHQQP